ncbi:MAG: hypothetical protein LBH81_03925 [Rickettsiales bacterium]|nr:hypothetical protein [Rickettsiales bacterium]
MNSPDRQSFGGFFANKKGAQKMKKLLILPVFFFAVNAAYGDCPDNAISLKMDQIRSSLESGCQSVGGELEQDDRSIIYKVCVFFTSNIEEATEKCNSIVIDLNSLSDECIKVDYSAFVDKREGEYEGQFSCRLGMHPMDW